MYRDKTFFWKLTRAQIKGQLKIFHRDQWSNSRFASHFDRTHNYPVKGFECSCSKKVSRSKYAFSTGQIFKLFPMFKDPGLNRYCFIFNILVMTSQKETWPSWNFFGQLVWLVTIKKIILSPVNNNKLYSSSQRDLDIKSWKILCNKQIVQNVHRVLCRIRIRYI